MVVCRGSCFLLLPLAVDAKEGFAALAGGGRSKLATEICNVADNFGKLGAKSDMFFIRHAALKLMAGVEVAGVVGNAVPEKQLAIGRLNPSATAPPGGKTARP